jgi:hypothetical protein
LFDSLSLYTSLSHSLALRLTSLTEGLSPNAEILAYELKQAREVNDDCNQEITSLRNSTEELESELRKTLTKLEKAETTIKDQYNKEKQLLTESHKHEIDVVKKTLNEKAFTNTVNKEKEITNLNDQIKSIQEKLIESERIRNDFHTNLIAVQGTKVSSIKDTEESIIKEKDISIENLNKEILTLKHNLDIQKSLVEANMTKIALKLDKFTPTQAANLFKSREYATTLLNNFVKINVSIMELNDKTRVHYEKLTNIHKELLSKDREYIEANTYMLKNAEYVESHKEIYSKQPHIEGQREQAYKVYENTMEKYERSKTLCEELQLEKEGLVVKLQSIEKETELYHKYNTNMTENIKTELTKAKELISNPQIPFAWNEVQNKQKEEYTVKINTLKDELVDLTNYSKRLVTMVNDTSSLFTKLSHIRDEQGVIIKYRELYIERRELLIKRLESHPDDKYIKNEIKMIELVLKNVPAMNIMQSTIDFLKQPEDKPKLKSILKTSSSLGKESKTGISAKPKPMSEIEAMRSTLKSTDKTKITIPKSELSNVSRAFKPSEHIVTLPIEEKKTMTNTASNNEID